ncbi:MAG: hypothetical protein ACI4QM_02755 [Alphaproteobacteria bacterium]
MMLFRCAGNCSGQIIGRRLIDVKMSVTVSVVVRLQVGFRKVKGKTNGCVGVD